MSVEEGKWHASGRLSRAVEGGIKFAGEQYDDRGEH
jgi:hypothetical protein